MKTDLPVVLEHGKRGLLSIDDGRLDVLQLSSDGNREPPLPSCTHAPSDPSAPKRLMASPLRLVLLAKLGAAPSSTASTTAAAPASASGVSGAESSAGSAGAGGKARLDLHALVQKGAKSHALYLTKIHVLVEASHAADAEAWCAALMAAAYPVTKPQRRVLLLLNPIGGKGKAKQLVAKEVVPVLEAAGCSVDMRETTHRNHAEEICAQIPLDYE